MGMKGNRKMTLPERLKSARELFRHTQKEMAKECSVSVQMWQAYESGSSTPGGKVFEALARFGFNVNWLLTGEGEKLLKPLDEKEGSPYIGKKIKGIRGETSVKEFGETLGVTEEEVVAIEDGKKEPRLSFISALNYHYGINPLLLMRHDVDPGKLKSKKSRTEPIDEELLKLAIEVVEEIEAEGEPLLSKQKAELVSLIYSMNNRSNYTKERLKRFIEAICVFLEQGVDFNELSERKLSNIIIQIAQHTVKGGEE